MARERLTISIDGELKRRFDIVCRWKDQNMSEIAQKLFTDWVEENAPPGLFDLEEKKVESAEQKNEPSASSNGTKGRGKEVKD